MADETKTPAPPLDEKRLLEEAVKKNDLRLLADLGPERLQSLKLASDLLEARFEAKKRSNRIATMSASLVGYVALAGFFANAYQNYNNKKHLEEQSEREQQKWTQEFKRSQSTDKHRAFFETSALVTDLANPDRRLIGYALLEEFISDREYQPKVVVILEESLAKELAGAEKDGDLLTEGHKNAVRQIVRTLSASPSCDELVFAARSIDKVSRRAHTSQNAELLDLFSLYVRRLIGRAVLVCRNDEEFASVREPIRDALARLPELVGLTKDVPRAFVNTAIAKILSKQCVDEVAESAISECPDIRVKYLDMCAAAATDPDAWSQEKGACEVVRAWPKAPRPPDVDEVPVAGAQ
jgi:hypothetical protein